MKEKVIMFVRRLAVVLEFFIVFLLAAGIILLCLRMASQLIQSPFDGEFLKYDELLETCFNLIIGVELIRLMYSHSAHSVFEVLLFAIAKQMLMDHTSILSSLIGACALAVLFAIKKFLFEDKEKFDLDSNIE